MWRSWSKSPTRIHDTSSSPPSTSSSSSSSDQQQPTTLFSCSSFKDIVNLAADDPTPTLVPSTANNNKSLAVFRRVRLAWCARTALSPPPIRIPNAEKRVVLYFTTLRVVRSTFEDCRAARTILRALRVPVEERDLSMDSGFIAELQLLLGAAAKLPRVFVGGRYVGGADELRQLHEAGELRKLVEGLPPADSTDACSGCGGFGFILCAACDGSHKVYFSDKGGFRSCSACNENGLTRCSSCSWSS